MTQPLLRRRASRHPRRHPQGLLSRLAAGVIAALLAGTTGCGSSSTPSSPPSANGGQGGGAKGGATGAGGSSSGQGGGGGGTVATGGAGGSSGSGGSPVDGSSAETANGDTTTSGDGFDTTVPVTNEGDGDRKIGPTYTVAPETQTPAMGVPRGKVIQFNMVPSDSLPVYSGMVKDPVSGMMLPITPIDAQRKVLVYVPAQYVAGTPAPVLVVQDGTWSPQVDPYLPPFQPAIINTLDNLIAQKKLPPIVAVMAAAGGGDANHSQRSVEYDTVSGTFAVWADTILLPRVEKETKTQLPMQAVTFTKDPEGRATMGGSSGAAAAFSMVWWRPDLFRRALTYSGTFVNQQWPANPMSPQGAWNYHDVEPYGTEPNGLVATTPAKPIRVWLQAGDGDISANTPPSSFRNFYLANQRMAKAMAAKGYHYHFDDAANARHIDPKVLLQTLPEAMLWVWRGYVGGQ